MQWAFISRTLGGIVKATWVHVLWSCREALDQSREHIPMAVTQRRERAVALWVLMANPPGSQTSGCVNVRAEFLLGLLACCPSASQPQELDLRLPFLPHFSIQELRKMAGMRMHQVRSVHSTVGQIIHIGSGQWAGDGEGYGHMTSHLEGVWLLTPAPGST